MTVRRAPNRSIVLALTLLVFVVTWIFRWLTFDITNDHFVHLSRARQVLLGELPIRDFFDPGMPLHYYASAAALMAFGQNLFGEAILTVTLVAAGAALVFYLSARTSRSVLLALVATAVAVTLFPRLYNYPKIFLYPLALVSIGHYAARRTTAALIALGALTAVATLFRLDHGLYIGIAATSGVILANVDQLRTVPRAFLTYAAVVVVLLLPFLLFIQMTMGIPAFLTDIREQRAAAAGARILAMPFAIAPGVLTAANALAWLYYATVLAPVIALVVLVVLRWRRGKLESTELVTIAAAIVMCLVIDQALLRGSPDSRLPDVAGPSVVLAAWITGTLMRAERLGARIIVGMVASVIWLATLWSATTYGDFGERMTASGLRAGRAATAERFHLISTWLHMRPIDFYAPPGESVGVRALTRYVLECTRPADRILAGVFEPQIFFYAERPFAGGQVYLKGGWHDSERAQRLTLERLHGQRVPMVIISAATEGEVQSRFPLVYAYVQSNYREVKRANFGGALDYAVLVKRDLTPKSDYAPLGLPCYR